MGILFIITNRYFRYSQHTDHLPITMSWSVYSPMFPSLTPRPADPLWFSVDRPVDDEAEHAKALQKISGQGSDLTPIGKTSNDQLEENEDEEDEDEDSESDHEDEDEEDVDMG